MFPKNLDIDKINKLSKNCMVGHLGIEFTEIGKDYIKGKMAGFWSRFDENGTLRETENYLSGNKNGKFKFYTRDGHLKSF